MKCMKFADKVDDFIDGYLPQREAEEMELHRTICQACRQTFQEEQNLRQTLINSEVPAIDQLSLERIMRGAKRDYKTMEKRTRVISFATALAACLILIVMTGLYKNTLMTAGNTLLSQGDNNEVTKTINLVVNCKSDMQQAELTIILPDNIELAARPGLHQVTWKADLKAGGNLLPLEVTTAAPGTTTITARIKHSTKSKTQTMSMHI